MHIKRNHLKYLFLIILFINLFEVKAQNQFKKPPKLVVGIVIEEIPYEMLLRYWDSFGENGFKKIINKGAFCTQMHYNYLITQNGPGQTSIVTGAYPNSHGIVSDRWYNRLKGITVDCADDSKFNYMNGDLSLGNFSPHNINSSTIGDELKLAFNDSSKVLSISLNPVSSVLSGGKSANFAFWFNNKDGNWITGNYYTDSLPPWVKEFNKKKFQDIYIDKNWASMHSLSNNYKRSLPDDSPFERGFINYRKTFPYDLSYLSNRSGNYKYLKYTPFGNTYTKDFAVSAIIGENLGKDQYPDLLTISFSASSYCREFFNPKSVEMEDILLRLDKDIEHLISFLDYEIGMQNVLVYITSDSGTPDSYEYLKHNKQNTGIFDGKKALTLLNSYLSILYQDGEWIKAYHSKQFFINQQLLDETGFDVNEIQDKATNFIVQFTGVANAIPAYIINSSNFNSGIHKKIQNSYYPKRSGDIIINLEPGWIEKGKTATESGSGYNYDTHVPLIWFGWRINNKRIDKYIEVTDIAPTISWILKIPAPNACVGKPIYDVIN